MAHIALVYAIEVAQYQHTHKTHGVGSLERSSRKEQQGGSRGEEEHERAQGVGLHHAFAESRDGLAVGRVRERIHVDILRYLVFVGTLLASQLIELLLQVLRGCAVAVGDCIAERSRSHKGEKTYQCGETETYAYTGLIFVPSAAACANNALEGEQGKQWHGKLGYDEYTLYGAELIVEGEVIDHEVGDTLGIAPQGEHYRENRCRHHGPFERSADNEAAGEEEGEDNDAGIYRAVCALGVVEILAHILQQGSVAGIFGGVFELREAQRHHVAAFGAGRGAALDVGHKETEHLAAAIAPAHNLLLGHAAGGTLGSRRGVGGIKRGKL